MGPGTPEEAPLQPKAGVSPEPRAGSPEPAQLSCFRGHGHKVGRSRVWCLSSGCSVNQQTLLSTLTRTLSLPGSCGCPRSSLSRNLLLVIISIHVHVWTPCVSGI